jgi:hypothetical protein
MKRCFGKKSADDEKKCKSEDKIIENLLDEINHKKNSWDTTRNNRIRASIRVKRKSENWNLIFTLMNIEAVSLFIFSIISPVENFMLFDSKINIGYLSGIFSLYVIFIQIYISQKNYYAQYYFFTTNQLEIEDVILEVKHLYRRIKISSSSPEMYEEEFNRIQDKYQNALKKGTDYNHDDIDSKSDEKNFQYCFLKIKDNFLVVVNLFIVLFMMFFTLLGIIW